MENKYDFKLNDQNRERINKIEKLILNTEYNLDQLTLKLTRYKLRLDAAMLILGNMYKHICGIVTLINSGYIDASTITLRTMYESYIRLVYITNDTSDKRGVAFKISDAKLELDHLESILKIYNEKNTEEKLLTKKQVEESIDKHKKDIDSFEAKYGKVGKLPPFRNILAEVDKDTKINNFVGNELGYFTLYWYFSTHTHPSSKNTHNIRYSTNKIQINIKRNNDDIALVLRSAYIIYRETLRLVVELIDSKYLKELDESPPSIE